MFKKTKVIILASIILIGFIPAITQSVTTAYVACVKTAVETRSNTLNTAVATYYNSLGTAQQARKTALLAAWDIVDDIGRSMAVETAWRTFKSARIAAVSIRKQAVMSAWANFKISKLACTGL